MDSDILKHYGVLGMKWGKRSSRKSSSSKLSTSSSKDYEKKKVALKKKTKELSNDEMRAAINRISLEKEYKKATATNKDKAKAILGEILINAGKQAATEALKSKLSPAFTKELDKVFVKKP